MAGGSTAVGGTAAVAQGSGSTVSWPGAAWAEGPMAQAGQAAAPCSRAGNSSAPASLPARAGAASPTASVKV